MMGLQKIHSGIFIFAVKRFFQSFRFPLKFWVPDIGCLYTMSIIGTVQVVPVPLTYPAIVLRVSESV